jgi:hypothetical protein
LEAIVANGLPGVDSSVPVTSKVEGRDLIHLAISQFNAVPAFWGRYFTSPQTKGSVEYRHALESAELNASGIPVLPIARQTLKVGGTAVQGAADAEANAADLLASFGADNLAAQSDTFFMFLDVEGAPSLAVDYYTAWAQALAQTSSDATGGKVTIRPCIYAAQGDAGTWQALAQAMANGADCGGAWVAHYVGNGCEAVPDWDDNAVTPKSGAPCTILAWQYAGDCAGGSLDFSQTNPALDPQATLLNFLMIPPLPAGS